MDKRVEIHGTSRADMNGKCGLATDFHPDKDKSKQRYTVRLDSGEAFKLKPANVRAEGTGRGGASGPTRAAWARRRRGRERKAREGREAAARRRRRDAAAVSWRERMCAVRRQRRANAESASGHALR